MKNLIYLYIILLCLNPVYGVTTRMFKVLDTCARYRLNEMDSFEAIEKLKLKIKNNNEEYAQNIVKSYCSVFTPNEKIEF